MIRYVSDITKFNEDFPTGEMGVVLTPSTTTLVSAPDY